jgi:hypothetical protein
MAGGSQLYLRLYPSGLTDRLPSGRPRSAWGINYHDQTGVINAGRKTLHSTAWNKPNRPGLSSGTGQAEAKGVFEGDRIAGRVVKYVDPGKSTKGESSHQGHAR